MIEEDKVALTHRRAKLVTSLAGPLSAEARVHIQGELSILNARIKALNTTQAAQLKAHADQRRVAGLAEAQANTTRYRTRVHGDLSQNRPEETEDSGQLPAIDAWIDAVLLRHDIDFTRSPTGKITFGCPSEWEAVLEVLVTGIYAAAQGQTLPDLPNGTPRPRR
jgi:hypothetical protein